MVSMVEAGSNWADVSQPDFGLLPREMVPGVWPLVLPILQTKGQKYLEVVSVEEVFGWLVDGRADLWLAMQNQEVDGFLIGHWEIFTHSRRYVVLYIAGTGLEKYFKQGLTKLEQYCSIMGGKELVLEGRKGWVRKLKRYGYYQDTVKLRKGTRVLWRN